MESTKDSIQHESQPIAKQAVMGGFFSLRHKLINFMFGWDFVFESRMSETGVIARVFRLPDGKIVFWRDKKKKILVEVKYEDQVKWLTCLPSKYGLDF